MSDKLLATAWESDQMQRGPVALFLSNYLDSNNKIKVLNINAPWGAGKTYFLNNWMLQEKTHRACVYFNAWENDFTGDAFVSLVSAVREQLQDIIGVTVKADSIVQEFTHKAARAMVAATPTLAKGVLKKLTGTDLDELKDLIDEDALGDAAEKAVETMITSSRDALNAVNDFKQVFHELLVAARDKAQSDETKFPVYIFIDELDRCRPTFSIELLERLKHLFDAPDCKFIIATDSQQLGEAIKAVYGNGFNSQKYLKRFFDSEFTLDNADYAAWIKANFALLPAPASVEMGHSVVDPLSARTHYHGSTRQVVAADKDTVLAGPHKLDKDQVIFLALTKAFRPQIRDLERIALKISSMQANVKSRDFYFFWAAYLVFLKEEKPEIYSEAITGDHNKVLNILISDSPPVKLSFVSSNMSIHELFFRYLNLFRSGQEEARKAARNHDGEREFLYTISAAFANEYPAMASYPNLVDLSYHLR